MEMFRWVLSNGGIAGLRCSRSVDHEKMKSRKPKVQQCLRICACHCYGVAALAYVLGKVVRVHRKDCHEKER